MVHKKGISQMLPPELVKIKRIAVFGMALSGISAVKALVSLGLEVHAVNEGEPDHWKERKALEGIMSSSFLHAQAQADELFSQMEMIILSPGIPITHEVLKKARNKNVPILSEIELGFWLARNVPVIAITGTNGKTTTTTMIAEALERSGKKVFCGGNIGLPYTELFRSGKTFDYAVIEVSSFQLETIRDFHPMISFILNITPNHTERYTCIEDYAKAKWNITKNLKRGDLLVVGKPTYSFPQDLYRGHWTKIEFDQKSLPFEFVQGFNFEVSKLKGDHNKANFYAAYCVLEFLQIPDRKVIFQQFIREFKGVPHRLEFVKNFNGLNIYNDAKSTNIEATKTALKAFDDKEPCYLILGGKLRSESDVFLDDLKPFKKMITEIFTIGMTGERLFHELKNDFSVENVKTIEALIEKLKLKTLKGNLIFSPAHPSFDQFKNYVHRGEEFKRLVNSLV
jgi:UDP-N-acetylmuramoylalanine--D-glutamate ligase